MYKPDKPVYCFALYSLSSLSQENCAVFDFRPSIVRQVAEATFVSLVTFIA